MQGLGKNMLILLPGVSEEANVNFHKRLHRATTVPVSVHGQNASGPVIQNTNHVTECDAASTKHGTERGSASLVPCALKFVCLLLFCFGFFFFFRFIGFRVRVSNLHSTANSDQNSTIL